MTFRPDHLLAHDFGERQQTYDARDAIVYALGVGLGAHPDDLRFVFEEQLAVLPTFAVTLASPGMWIRDPRFGVDFGKLVHLEQDAEFNAPLPAEGAVVGEAKVASVRDRGAGRGAELVLERSIRSPDAHVLYAKIRQTLLLRGDGGFGGEPATRAESVIPHRAPDLSAALPLSTRANLIYRLSGDRNPLHVDPDFARNAGFERPIMHGLGTYAAAGIAVARALGIDPASIRRLACRFSGIVYPGQLIVLTIWREPIGAAFTAYVGDRKVLDQGWMEFAQ